MKKLFLGKNAKNLVGRAATLAIIGLIAATTFIVVSPSFARTTQTPQDFCQQTSLPSGLTEQTCETMLKDSSFSSALKTFLQSNPPTFQFPFRGSRSVPPALTKNPQCPAFTDALLTNGSNSWTLKVVGDATCDFVNWTFPASIANKNCTFKADGSFDDGLNIGFYSTVRTNGSSHAFDTSIDSAAVSGGTFTVTNTNIRQAFLDINSGRVGQINLGNISYTCS